MAGRKSTLIRSLQRILGPVEGLQEHRPLEQIILLLLSHGSTPAKARTAMKKLQCEYVDWNELRVSSPFEVREWLRGLGAKALPRAEQLCELLTVVYNRFNKVSLDALLDPELPSDERRRRDRFESWMLDRAKGIAAAERKAKKKKAAKKKTSTRGAKRKTSRATGRKKTARRVTKKAAKKPARKTRKKATKKPAKKSTKKKVVRKAQKKTVKKKAARKTQKKKPTKKKAARKKAPRKTASRKTGRRKTRRS